MVDTDVLVDYLRGREPGASWLAARLADGTPLATTVVNRFELRAGVRTEAQGRSVRTLLRPLRTLALDERAADEAAGIRRGLQEADRGIGVADSLVAGIVRASAGTLVTRNVRHFERVPELTVIAPE